MASEISYVNSGGNATEISDFGSALGSIRWSIGLHEEADLHLEGTVGPPAAVPVPQNAVVAPFANAMNVETSLVYLEAALRDIGIDVALPLGSMDHSDAATFCNALAKLLDQHKRQRVQISKMGDEAARLQSDIRIALKGKDGLSIRLDDNMRQLAQTQNQAAVDAEAFKKDLEKLTAERDSARTAAADLRQRRCQIEHELRRKDLELERLQKRLRDLLSEKEKGERASMATVGKYKGSMTRGGQREDDLKRIVSSYEAKLAQARGEISGLKAALQSLQDEHRALINTQVRQDKPPPNTDGDNIQSSEPPSVVLQELAQRINTIHTRVQEIERAAGAAMSQEELQTSLGSRMFLRHQELLSLLVEQRELARKAFALASQQESAPSLSCSKETGDAQNDSAPGEASPTAASGEATQPGTITASDSSSAWIQLEEERQALAFKAEEFDKTCETFHELLKQYAPGFGAGSFLFRRIEKTSRAVAKKSTDAAHFPSNALPMQPILVNNA